MKRAYSDPLTPINIKMSTKDWKNSRIPDRYALRSAKHLIFCEGDKTEPLYFRGFKKAIETCPIYEEMIEIFPHCGDTQGVLKSALTIINARKLQKAHIWCVFDKDDFPIEHFNGVSKKIEELNRKYRQLRFHSIWSNECFEFWLLLHFSLYSSNNHRSIYLKNLNENFKKRGLGSYRKNDSRLFEELLEIGNPKLAIRHAERILRENKNRQPSQIAPGTKVQELVKALAVYLPKDLQSHFL